MMHDQSSIKFTLQSIDILYDDFTVFLSSGKPMKDARPILDKFIHADDYEKLGLAVSAGYVSCFNLMQQTPALGAFMVGVPQWSHLVRTFVEHSLSLAPIEGMTYEFRPNAARNCWHVRYFKNGIAWTSHFAGGGDNKRGMAREAICRVELANRTLPLFPEDDGDPNVNDDTAYFQILHAGYKRIPESIVALIPSRDQRFLVAGVPLPIVEPPKAQVEQVAEEMQFRIRAVEKSDADEQDASAG